jgi:hypothetical protein
MAFVSVTLRAWTEQDAAESFARITKRAATAGARWRLATGLEVEILAVTPID